MGVHLCRQSMNGSYRWWPINTLSRPIVAHPLIKIYHPRISNPEGGLTIAALSSRFARAKRAGYGWHVVAVVAERQHRNGVSW